MLSPAWAKGGRIRDLEAAGSGTRGSGRATSGPASPRPLPWKYRTAQSRQAHPEEARPPSSGAAKGCQEAAKGGRVSIRCAVLDVVLVKQRVQLLHL